jgi:radial spoke head protein 9
MYEFPQKKFHWALGTDFNFVDMPDLNEQHTSPVDRDDNLFMGDPKKVLVNVENKEGDEDEEAPADDGGEDDEEGKEEGNQSDKTEEEEIKIPPKNLREVDRLAFIVRSIEDNCQIAPVGAFKMTPHHEVTRNEAFRGLCREGSLKFENYVHFRNVQDESKKASLDDPSTPFNDRFLECIEADKPFGQWTSQLDQSGKNTILRSLLWPGYSFYHTHGTKRFGSVYIGDGLKNQELAFML